MQLQNRILDLQNQLEQLRTKLQANPAGMSFKAVLTELGVVNAGFGQLHKEIRPHLQFYVAHPQYIGPDDAVSTLPGLARFNYVFRITCCAQSITWCKQTELHCSGAGAAVQHALAGDDRRAT